jgi:uncharacterized secreted protein with C-terminal beta-propeller domain
LSPSYNIISVVNVANSNEKVTTNVIAGSTNEIYMSLDNLYFTSYLYKNGGFGACPMGAMCIMPRFTTSQNTLVHKLNISGNKLTYQDSTILPGTPLTQYSMDEYQDNFRIITQTNSWTSSSEKSYVDLYILDKNLKLI